MILDLEVSVSDGNSVVSRTVQPAVYNNVFDDNHHAVSKPVDTDNNPNQIIEGSTNGSLVNITVFAQDDDITQNAVTYSLTNDAGGRFQINDNTGLVSVNSGNLIDFEDQETHTITVKAISDDTSVSYEDFQIEVINDPYDDNNHSVTLPVDVDVLSNQVMENSDIGTTVGITFFAEDKDLSNNKISYSLTSSPNDLFAIDLDTGVITVSGLLDYELSHIHSLTVEAKSQDGSVSSSDFTINVIDDPSDNPTPIQVRIGRELTQDDITDNSTNF